MGAPAVAALPSGAHGVFVTGDCAPLCWDARGGPISTLPRWPHPQLRSTTSTQPASKFFLLQNAQAQPLVIRWSKTHAQLPPRPSSRLPTPQLRWLCRPLLLGAYASIADPRSLSARGSGGLNALLPSAGRARPSPSPSRSVPAVPCNIALVPVLLPPPVWTSCPQLPAALQLGERVGQLVAVLLPSPGSTLTTSRLRLHATQWDDLSTLPSSASSRRLVFTLGL